MTKESREEIYRYLDEHGVVDKDSRKRNAAGRNRRFSKIKRGTRLELNLHGKTEEEALHELRACINSCRGKGIREVLVIHGRGLHSSPDEGPVLKKAVRGTLEHELRSSIKGFRPACPDEGGQGATVVNLF